MILKLGMDHLCTFAINDDPGLTLTYFMAMSDFLKSYFFCLYQASRWAFTLVLWFRSLVITHVYLGC